MIRRLFVGVPILSDDNFDFELMTEAEVKQAEEEAESVYEYLTQTNFQTWIEVACSETNLQKLQELCNEMKRELDGR